MPDIDDNQPRKKRGWARMRELDAADAAERQMLETELLAYLGRAPVAIDRIAVETLVASVVRARRLRAQGKSDAEERKIILQSIRATGIRPPAAGPPSAPNLQDLLDAVAAGAAASDDDQGDDE